MNSGRQTVHATSLLIGERALLIRGPSGAGKSRLALRLLAHAKAASKFARLIADDQTHVERAGNYLLAYPPPQLAGRIEQYGFGLLEMPYEPAGVIGAVIELAHSTARLPSDNEKLTKILGITLPLLSFPQGADFLLEELNLLLDSLKRLNKT